MSNEHRRRVVRLADLPPAVAETIRLLIEADRAAREREVRRRAG